MATLLTKKEAAEYLRVCMRTIDRWCKQKLLSSTKVRNVIRFAQSELDDFLIRNRR